MFGFRKRDSVALAQPTPVEQLPEAPQHLRVILDLRDVTWDAIRAGIIPFRHEVRTVDSAAIIVVRGVTSEVQQKMRACGLGSLFVFDETAEGDIRRLPGT